MRRFSAANSDASKPPHGSKHSRGHQGGSVQKVSATAKSNRRYELPEDDAVDDDAAARVQSQTGQQQDDGEKFEVAVSSMQGDENEPDKPMRSSRHSNQMDFNDTDYLDRSVDLGTMLK